MSAKKITEATLKKYRDCYSEGFPEALDQDIIELSNPPYYACFPNFFLEEYMQSRKTSFGNEKSKYDRKPFATDVSEGKNTHIYNAHSYHTKVPYAAVMKYILHYTEPGDIVYDCFCGTGMTGIAATMCGSPDSALKSKVEEEMDDIKWGARKAVLNDLSPAATFIAHNYNSPVDNDEFLMQIQNIIKKVEESYGWMYQTQHIVDGQPVYDDSGTSIMGRINYTVWSDIFICPKCEQKLVFWDIAVDKKEAKVKKELICPYCNQILQKKEMQRVKFEKYDDVSGEDLLQAKQVPVLINYSINNKRYQKRPDYMDMQLLDKIEALPVPYWYPTDPLPEGLSIKQPKFSHDVNRVDDFYYRRTLFILSYIRYIIKTEKPKGWRRLLFAFTSILEGTSRLNRERPGGMPSKLNGTLYIGSLVREINPIDFFSRKAAVISKVNIKSENFISTGSSTNMGIIPDNSVDYIFIDPPFGSNIMYSELNFNLESWLKIKSNYGDEAIINKVRNKKLSDYAILMDKSFAEMQRVLKPGRWLTLVFHNSDNEVWNVIQDGLLKAGFLIVDVKFLDKRQGSFKQVTSDAVKMDLVVSCYKPKILSEKNVIKAGSKSGVWRFIEEFLAKQPVPTKKDAGLEIIIQRCNYALYDNMVAYHLQKGLSVPMGTTEFYKGLKERFIEIEGMYFLTALNINNIGGLDKEIY